MTVNDVEIICRLTVELTKLRQNECKHLCIENFAPELFAMRIFLETDEWYPVPTPKRIKRKDIGAEVPDRLVYEWEKAQKDFWRAASALERSYRAAQT